MLETIIEDRLYVAAYAANQADPAGWDKSPLRTLAMEIEHELAAEEIDTRE